MPRSDNYSIRDYGQMIADAARTAPLVEALRRAVRPGSVVLDLGTGPGFFALLACQLGAARVYAVEPDAGIEIGRQSASSMAGGERITWLRGRSTELELPERASVVIADLHGTLPFYGQHLTALIDARRRHLAPEGVMIPYRDRLFAAPAEAPDEYEDVIRPWQSNEAGVDLTAGRRYVTNAWWRARREPIAVARYLAPPSQWAELSFASLSSPNASGACRFELERAGTLHGYYVWFDGETAAGIGFSNAPTLPERVYGRAFFPLQRPVEVVSGDTIETAFRAHLVADEYVFTWNTTVVDAHGHTKAELAQSTFASKPLLKEDLARARPEFRPSLGEEGRILLLLLESMARGDALSEAAARLREAFPARFDDPNAALRHAADASLKYSR